MNPEAKQFLEGLSLLTSQDASKAANEMNEEECALFVSDFVSLISSWKPELINIQKDPLQTAATSLFLARLFPLAFEKAYIHIDKLQTAKDSLSKVFK